MGLMVPKVLMLSLRCLLILLNGLNHLWGISKNCAFEKFSYHEISWLVEWFLKVLIISSYFLNFYVLLIHSELHIRISTYF